MYEKKQTPKNNPKKRINKRSAIGEYFVNYKFYFTPGNPNYPLVFHFILRQIDKEVFFPSASFLFLHLTASHFYLEKNSHTCL